MKLYLLCDQNLFAILTTSGRFLVFEWHTVTVASFHLSSSETGVPTILLRPLHSNEKHIITFVFVHFASFELEFVYNLIISDNLSLDY